MVWPGAPKVKDAIMMAFLIEKLKNN